MAQQRSVPPRLSVPRPPTFQPQLSINKTARIYPTFTPTSSNSSLIFSPLYTPTPSKRSRAPQGPLWLFTVLHLLSFYLLHQWLSGSSSSPPLAIFAFSSVLIAALCLNIIYRPWKGRHILSSQWGLLFISGALLALSYCLRFQGLQSAGPLETIFADFAGFLATRILLDSSNKSSETIRKARGLVALLLGVFLLSHGWARVSCSPLAIDVSYRTRIKLINQREDCVKVWSMLAPFLGGVLSALQRMIGARTALKNIGKKRIQVLSYAMGSLALLPVTLMQIAASGQSPFQYRSSFWPVASVVAFGMSIAFFSEFYTEEKLFLPVHSLKAFQILSCCVCGLELLYGLGISLVGFVFCSLVLGIGVQELSQLQGQLSWDELGDTSNGSLVFASWIRRPVQHMFSDKKSRKIAIFLLINTGFMVVEFVYGFLRNSLGLISDACHMLFDCAALAIGLYASYISRLPENSKFNYGYGRFEVVSGYANAVLLVLVASLIVLESIERILEPPEISTESLLVVSVGGLLVNIVGLIFFHEHHHHAHGHGGCSHSHSSHKSPHGAKSSSKDTKVDLAAIAYGGSSHSPSHKQYHSGMAQDNGHRYSSSAVEGGHNSIHNTQINYHNNQGMSHPHHQDHDHHNCSGQDSHSGHQHSSHHNHQVLSLEHEHDHSSSHHHRHHHHHHDDGGDHASAHSHACSSGHALHYSEGHYDASKHNHGDGGSHHDHSHGHNHNGIQYDDYHGQSHQHHDQSHGHHHHDDHDDFHDHSHDQSHGHHDDHHDHGHDHQHHMDHNMYGMFLHVLADTLGSVGVVISTLLIKYKGWLITDPACSIFLSVLIVGSVVPLLRNTAEILLQRVPRHNERSLKEAVKRVGQLDGVQSVGRVHVWSFTDTETVGSLHVQLAAGSDRKLAQEKALRMLHEAGIKDLTLQIEEVS